MLFRIQCISIFVVIFIISTVLCKNKSSPADPYDDVSNNATVIREYYGHVILLIHDRDEGTNLTSLISSALSEYNVFPDKIRVNRSDELCEVFLHTLKTTSNKSSIIVIDEERVEGRDVSCPYKVHLGSPTSLQIYYSGYSTNPYVIAYLSSKAGKINYEMNRDRFDKVAKNIISLFLHDFKSEVHDPLTPRPGYTVSEEMIKKLIYRTQKRAESRGTSISHYQFWFGWLLVIVGFIIGILTIDNRAFVNYEVKEFDIDYVRKEK